MKKADNDQHTLHLEWEHFTSYLRDCKWVFVAQIFYLLLAYGIKLMHYSISIDTEAMISAPNSLLDSWLKMGRFGLVYLKKILAQIPLNPYIVVFLMMIFLLLTAISLGYIVYTYSSSNHHRKLAVLISTCLFLTFPTFTEQFNFLLQSLEVTLSLLFCTVSVLFAMRWATEKTSLSFPFGSILLAAIGISCYQSINTFYIALASGSFLLFCTDHNDVIPHKNSKRYFCAILKLAALFLIAFTLYWCVNKAVITHYFGPGFKDAYTGDQVLWGKVPLSDALHNIWSYLNTLIFGDGLYYSKLFLVTALGIGFYAVKKLLSDRPEKLCFFIATLFFLCTPLLMSVLLGSHIDVRVQMALPVVVAIGLGLLISRISINRLQVVLSVVALMMCFYQGNFMSQMYHSDYLRYRYDVSLGNKVSSQIEQLGYGQTPDLPIIYVGAHATPEIPGMRRGSVIGYSFFEWDCTATFGSQGRIAYFMDTLGYVYRKPTESQVLQGQQYAKNMPSWPNDGAVVALEDMIIVKFSDR